MRQHPTTFNQMCDFVSLNLSALSPADKKRYLDIAHTLGAPLARDAVFIRTVYTQLKERTEPMAKRKKSTPEEAPEDDRPARKSASPAAPVGKKAAAFPVKFAGVTTTVDRVKLGCTVARTSLSMAAAEKLFVDAELSCNLDADPNSGGDVDGQTKAFADGDLSAEVVAEVTGFTVKKDRFGFSLSIPRDEHSSGAEELIKFANLHGNLQCEKTGPAKKRAKPKANADDPTE